MTSSVSSPPPQAFEYLGYLCWRGMADSERHQRKLGQHRLQEGQLHLERVFERM